MARILKWSIEHEKHRTWDAVVMLHASNGGKYRLLLEFKAAGRSEELVRTQLEALTRTKPIGATILRAVPFGEIEVAAKQHRAKLTAKRVPMRSRQNRGPQHGRRLSDSDLKRIGEIYLQSSIEGEPPRVNIAREFDISTSAAAKRIMAARRRGFLGSALVGKIGEVS